MTLNGRPLPLLVVVLARSKRPLTLKRRMQIRLAVNFWGKL